MFDEMQSGKSARNPIWRWAGLFVVIAFFVLGGIAHFAFADAEMSIIPPYIPYPNAVNDVTGFFELLGAVGMMFPFSRRAAATGLVLLAICVTPANVYMLQHADRFPTVPLWALIARLPLQVVLIFLIAWSGGLLASRAHRMR